MSQNALRSYLGDVQKLYQTGTVTELSYRPDCRDLLQAIIPGITATNEPKHVECGAPDYLITRSTRYGPLTVGYVEAKDVGLPLDKIEKSEQLIRYRRALPNLLLTDYVEFRWYVVGELRMTGRIASVGPNRKLNWDAEGATKVEQILQGFLTHSAESLRQPRDLAERMARLAHFVRDRIIEAFEKQAASSASQGLYKAFKEVLLPELSIPDFADMFAQTLAYGLFAARCNHKGNDPFRRQDAAHEIPKTNPFLRRLFGTITGPDLEEEPYIDFVNDLAQLLSQADMNAVLADFGKRTRQEDPVVHFYETFLSSYDPKLRELRGVYYTPEPVVSYLVRSVDHLLQTYFDCPDGLADTSTVQRRFLDEQGEQRLEQVPRVLLLDPACGTGTFTYTVIDHIRTAYRKQKNAGMWSAYVRQHLLPRLFSFELLMAPYAVAHLKLGMQLAAMDLPEDERSAWAYDFQGNERLGIYLTNTLEEAAKRSDVLMGRYISDEANEAARVKKDYPVMVVLGNPPYSGHSANNGTWIINLLHGKDGESDHEVGNYFKVDGQPLGERNPKWLNDDYVKFIRFAQWRIERSGYGILAFITNHGYLDNPTFRGMRQSLMQTFDDIYVLDLHGNSKKKERAPDGGKDENVFDIQQGVAIGIFVKRRRADNTATKPIASVHHAHLWGTRGKKYEWLASASIGRTEWKTLSPQTPSYLFKPQETDAKAEYEQGLSIPAVFGTGNPKTDGGKAYGLGICTHNDLLFVGWTEEEVHKRVQMLASESITDADILQTLPVEESPYWKTTREREKVRKSSWREKIWPIYYRPFDWRTIYYEPDLMEIGRGGASRQVMPHAKLSPLNLMVSRGYEIDSFEHVLVANAVAVHHAATRKEGNYVFPLYLYPDGSKRDLWGIEAPSSGPGGRRANIAPGFVQAFGAKLGMTWVEDGKGDRQQTFGPEDVFSYLYAILHAPTYRERYAEFLKIDFPRLPLTSDVSLFRDLCTLGDELVRLHLLEGKIISITSYPVKGNNMVESARYAESQPDGTPGRIYINNQQYFEGVAPEVWGFHIGGYQVCQKWLKDRKGRPLTYEDLTHYQKIIAALAESIRLMEKIDEAIEEHGGWPIG